jgi:hypothetical protein
MRVCLDIRRWAASSGRHYLRTCSVFAHRISNFTTAASPCHEQTVLEAVTPSEPRGANTGRAYKTARTNQQACGKTTTFEVGTGSLRQDVDSSRRQAILSGRRLKTSPHSLWVLRPTTSLRDPAPNAQVIILPTVPNPSYRLTPTTRPTVSVPYPP